MAGGFTCFTSRNIFFTRASNSPLAPPWKTLPTKTPPGFSDIVGDIERRFEQRDGAQMIGRAMAGGRRGHVGQHDIGRSAERVFQQSPACRDRADRPATRWRRGAAPSPECRPPTTLPRSPTRLTRDLGPAAGRRAEIEHARALLQKTEFVVELDQLERRARAIAFVFAART